MPPNLRIATSESFGSGGSPTGSPKFDKQSDKHSSKDSKTKTKDPRENEQRKLLQLLLSQLETRQKPPSVYDEFKISQQRDATTGFEAVAETVFAAVKLKSGKHAPPVQPKASTRVDESDDEDHTADGVYTANETYRLMESLKDVLLKANRDGFSLYDEMYVPKPS